MIKNPIWRDGMTDKQQAAKVVVVHMMHTGLLPSCFTCEHFDRKVDRCDKFSIRPPAEVIIFSCGKDWSWDIPF